MDRTGTAVAEADEVSRAVALGRHVGAQILAQLQIQQFDHPGRRIFHLQAQGICDLLLDVLARTLHVQLDGSAQEVVGVEIAQHDVAIGHRHGIQTALRPAGAYAIACGVGTQLDGATVGIDAHEGTSAGTHGIHRDQRQREHQSRHVRIGRNREIALGDQRHVERGAADVGAGDIVIPQGLAQQLGSDDATDGAGNNGACQLGSLPGNRSAVRGHHAQVELCTMLLEAVAHLLERLARRLCRIGLQNGGIHAVAFLARRIVVHAGKHRHFSARFFQFVTDDVPHLALAVTILVRLQQADHDGLGAFVQQFTRGLAYFCLAHGNDDGALHIGALGHTTGPVQRHQRLVVAVRVQVDALLEGVAQVALDGTAHGMHMLESLVADQAHIQTLALHHPVEHRRAAVHAGHQFRIDVIHRALPVRQRIFRRIENGEGFILRIALRLAHHKAPIPTNKEGIGHRAPGIDAHDLNRCLH